MPHFSYLLTSDDEDRARLIRAALELGVSVNVETSMWLENYECKGKVHELLRLIEDLHKECEELRAEIFDLHYALDESAR